MQRIRGAHTRFGTSQALKALQQAHIFFKKGNVHYTDTGKKRHRSTFHDSSCHFSQSSSAPGHAWLRRSDSDIDSDRFRRLFDNKLGPSNEPFFEIGRGGGHNQWSVHDGYRFNRRWVVGVQARFRLLRPVVAVSSGRREKSQGSWDVKTMRSRANDVITTRQRLLPIYNETKRVDGQNSQVLRGRGLSTS